MTETELQYWADPGQSDHLSIHSVERSGAPAGGFAMVQSPALLPNLAGTAESSCDPAGSV